MTQNTETAPRIVVVGGVAGGASAATRARRMNEQAEIVLFEKDPHVSFANCGLPYYVGEEIAERDKLLVAKPALFRDRFNIDVRVRQEVTAIDRERAVVSVHDHESGDSYEQPYDKLILAPGAAPIVPPIEGVDAQNVFTMRNLEDTDRIKAFVDEQSPRRAVVVGAGYIGLEVVEQLRRRGVGVELVELTEQVLPLLDAEMTEPIQQALNEQDVKLRLGDGIGGIVTDGKAKAHAVTLQSGAQLNADLVIMGIGVRPNTQLADQAGLSRGKSGAIAVNAFGQTDDPNIYAVGDAAEYLYGPTCQSMRVPLGGPANRAGRIAGEHAATGRSAKMAPVYGTAIVRVFEWAAAITGLSIKAARRAGLEARSVTIIAPHHAGYYPGASPITLKLVYAPDTGRVLGAQAIGQAGVDKRIDVIATAMAFGATVHDLAGLDLAYAPPFGAAKDPVHMAAFAACNEVDGVTRYVDAAAALDDYQVVDVRSDQEVQSTPLPEAPHAIHIPLDQLRDRLSELDTGRPTVTVCGSGQRSHVAARLLAQHGFDEVWNLAGGYTMRRRALTRQPRASTP